MAEYDNISFGAIYWKMEREYRIALRSMYDMEWLNDIGYWYPYCKISWDALYPFPDDDERLTFKGYYSMVK